MKTFRWIAALLMVTAFGLIAGPPEARDTDTVIHHLPDRRVIIERAPGIILPDPPLPAVRPAAQPGSAGRLAAFSAEWRAHRLLHPSIHAGATVYRLPDGKTVTLVTQWRVNDGPPVSFWSSADFSLLAHPGGFTRTTPEGEVNHTMLLLWSSHDVAMWKDLAARRGREYQPPDLPEFPEGPATWIVAGNGDMQKTDPVTERAIKHLHEHYNQNLTQLRQAYALLEAERAARRAELLANPPQPRDIHLRVSRLDPAQAAAWHRHAAAKSAVLPEAPEPNGGGK
jgi:hypothetical protein